MRIPESVIEEISRRINIVDVVSQYVALKPSGSRYMGLCPFHSEKTPSFSVNPAIGAYYCFGCHKGGSVFNFIMEMDGVSFPEAVKLLGEKVGVEVEAEPDDEATRKRKALRELYAKVSRSFAHLLTGSEGGMRAMEVLRGRGVDADTIEHFGLGYAPDDPFWLAGFLARKQYSEAFLAECGLFTRANPRRALFAARIMFPIRNARTEVVGFGGRIVEGDGPKYINSPETEIFHKRNALYGIDRAGKAIRRARQVTICEGYMDVLAFHQAAVETAVAPLGTALTESHAELLGRVCDRAVLVFDPDDAGVRATRRAVEILEPHGIQCSVAVLPDGVDPADLARDRGSQALRDAISSPLSALDFLIRAGLKGRAAVSPESKEFVMREVYPYISVMPSEVKRRESLRLAADLVGVDRDAVFRDYARYHRLSRAPGASREAEVTGRELKPPTGNAHKTTSHDVFLMLAAVSNRDQFAYVRQWIQPEDLEDAAAREIYVALEEAFRRGESSLELLLRRIESAEVVHLLRERLGTGEFDGSQDQAVRDGVRAVRERVLRRKVREVETKLRRLASATGGADDELELLGEKMYLDRELQKLKGEG